MKMDGNEIHNKYIKFCPVCKKEFDKKEVIDILILGFICNNNHSFFVPKESVLTAETGRKFLKLYYDSNDKKEISRAWLTNPTFRKHLNDQIAEVLRLCLETESDIYHKNSQNERKFNFCSICSKELTNLDIQDLYMTGLKCGNNHRFFERGSKLYFSIEDGLRLSLCMDMDYTFLKECIESFLNNRHFKKYLPHQVRELLLYYKDKII